MHLPEAYIERIAARRTQGAGNAKLNIMSEQPGSNVLETIVAARRRSLEETRSTIPLERVREMAEEREERRDFAAALRPSRNSDTSPRVRVIAELKRASPSRGLLRQHYRRREIALSYEAAGASALSVLTEERYFLGSIADLTEVRHAVTVPVLRKDFIVDEYQVYESVAAGADALLLIVAILPQDDLVRLLHLCSQIRVAALVEVHTEEELHRAADAGAGIIGINNRDLKTLEINLETSLRLRSKIPSGCIAISESGIKSASELWRIRDANFDAVLIGERLMIEQDPGGALRKLLVEGAGQLY